MLYPNTDAMIVTITRGNQWWTHVFSFMQNGLVETRPRKIVRYSSRWSPPRKSLVKGERFVREWRKPRADKFKSEWQVDRSWQMKLVVSLALCAPEKIAPRQGIEPWSPAWQAGILTTILSRTERCKYFASRRSINKNEIRSTYCLEMWWCTSPTSCEGLHYRAAP